MSKFKVGDKVKIINSATVSSGIDILNEVAEVIGVDKNYISLTFSVFIGDSYTFFGDGKPGYSGCVLERDIVLFEKKPPSIYKVAEFCLSLNKK
jgi:hypothetical protein